MLETLESVPWGTLTHAEGNASDLPELLRRIGGVSAEVRIEALRKLFAKILHRGTVCEATSHVVPFLIELLGQPRTGDKNVILHFLGEISRAIPPSAASASSPPRTQIPEKEIAWVRATRAAVHQGRPLYQSYLESQHPPVRACAAFAAALAGGPEPRLAQVFRERIVTEQNDVVRASLVIALNHMDDLLDGLLFQDLQSKAQGALTRWAAAAAQVARWDRQSAPKAIDELVASLSIGGMVQGVFPHLPWGSGNMVADTASLLAGVGPGAAPTVVPRLVKAFRAAAEPTALVLAEVILVLSFPERKGMIGVASEHQKEALETFAGSARLGSESPLRGLLKQFGLPGTREELLKVARSTAP